MVSRRFFIILVVLTFILADGADNIRCVDYFFDESKNIFDNQIETKKIIKNRFQSA